MQPEFADANELSFRLRELPPRLYRSVPFVNVVSPRLPSISTLTNGTEQLRLGRHSRSSLSSLWLLCVKIVLFVSMKAVNFNAVKRQEARSRMADLRKARRSPQATAKIQRRVSLIGNGAKWRITNFKEVARAMAKWA
jgi:hypothetical protein